MIFYQALNNDCKIRFEVDTVDDAGKPLITMGSTLNITVESTYSENVRCTLRTWCKYKPTSSVSMEYVSVGELTKGTPVNVSWTSDLSEWGEYCSDAFSIPGKVEFWLYDIEDGKTIATNYIEITMAIPEPENAYPSITSVTIEDENPETLEKFSAFVQEKSKLTISISAEGIYGSTIRSYKTTFDGSTYWKSTFEHEKIVGNGEIPIVVTVRDSRGRSVSKTITINVLPYISPTITNFNCYRCNENGTENPNGTRVKAVIGYEIAEVNNLNDKSCTLYYRETNFDIWTSVENWNENYIENKEFVSLPIFDVEKTYDFKLVVEDFFGVTEKAIIVSQAFTIVDFNESGKGMAIGKVSEIEDAFEVGIPAKFVNGILYPILTSGTDLNSLMISNKYILLSDSEYSNIPNVENECILEIIGRENESVIQILSTVSKTNQESFKRTYDVDGWGEWVDVNADIKKLKNDMKNILNLVYPIGSIYMSANNTSPETLFGGTWEQIEDRFLLAAGSKSVGSTGGAEEYNLSVSHKHTAPIGYSSSAFGAININGTVSTGSGKAYRTVDTGHSGTLDSNVTGLYTSNATVSDTIPTMPPYLVVYVWKRTA